MDDSSRQGGAEVFAKSQLAARTVALGRSVGVEPDSELRRVVEGLDPSAPSDYRVLAALLALDWRATRPRRIGLCGGQGTGKSTLSRLLEAACAAVGLRAVVLSLDDYYLPRVDRSALARRVHPLFETRGAPGTHDVARLQRDLEELGTGTGMALELPIFDKGRDDRSGTRRVVGPFDLVVIEGWCVGARAQAPAELEQPCNALERDADPDGIWRRHVDAALGGDYARLWGMLDQLVFLRAPDLAAVRRWRLEQEAGLPSEERMDAAAIDRFVEHYERITRGMLCELPDRADWTVVLGSDHSIAGLARR